MAYRRISVTDYVDRMDAEKYNNVQDGIDEVKASDLQRQEEISNANTAIQENASNIVSVQADISDLSDVDTSLDERLTTVENIISGGSSATMTASNTTGWINTTVSSSQDVNISFTWSSIESELPTGDGAITITVNNVLKVSQAVQQGNISFNVKQYLTNGKNSITVKITDIYGTFKTFKLTVNVITLSVTSTFDFEQVRTGTSSIQFNATAKGSIEKTIYVKVDGNSIYSDTTTQATKTYTVQIPVQEHGVHEVDCYVTATVGGSTIESNHITGKFIWYSESGSTVLKVDGEEGDFSQYDNYSFKYQVYNSSSLICPIKITVGNQIVVSDNVDRTVHTYRTRLKDSGEVVFVIESGDEQEELTLDVSETELPVTIETQGCEMMLRAEGKTQLLNPNQWTDDYGTTTTFEKVPIWDNNEDSGTRLILVDNKATINKKIFTNDFKQNGKTIEFDFEINDMTSLSEVVISCMSDGRGIEITNQDFTLYSDALNAKQYFNTGERVHVAYVIESQNANRFIYLYINGVLSQLKRYDTSDIFNQTIPVNITLEARGCKLYVYNVISYTTALEREQVLDNFIASHENIDELLSIYDRCDVMTNGEIDRNKLKDGCEYIILETPNAGQELPQAKGDDQIINIYYINHDDPSRNWTCTGAKCKVQGKN